MSAEPVVPGEGLPDVIAKKIAEWRALAAQVREDLKGEIFEGYDRLDVKRRMYDACADDLEAAVAALPAPPDPRRTGETMSDKHSRRALKSAGHMADSFNEDDLLGKRDREVEVRAVLGQHGILGSLPSADAAILVRDLLRVLQ